MPAAAAFDFFGLPRELRDFAYGYLLNGNKKLTAQKYLRMKVKNAPSMNLMLVSHEFSTEYREAIRFHSSIVCADTGKELPEVLTLRNFPAVLSSVTRVEFRIWLVCNESSHIDGDRCTLRSDLDLHLAWIREIASKTSVSKITILLGLHIDDIKECKAEFFRRCQELISSAGTCELVVRRGNPRHEQGSEVEPRVVSVYDSTARELQSITMFDDEIPKTEEDLGFSAEDSELEQWTDSDGEEDEGQACRYLAEERMHGGRYPRWFGMAVMLMAGEVCLCRTRVRVMFVSCCAAVKGT